MYIREIELKFTTSIKNRVKILELLDRPISGGVARDLYWPLPSNLGADFLRLRTDSRGSELTIKKKDQESNFDRLEINLPILSGVEARAFFDTLLGPHAKQITKKYDVFNYEGTILGVYSVDSEDPDLLFLEVEATSKHTVRQAANKLTKLMGEGGVELTPQPSSLFELYVKEEA